MILEQERYFTPRKFLNTGREMFVEMRGSLHTKSGSMSCVKSMEWLIRRRLSIGERWDLILPVNFLIR